MVAQPKVSVIIPVYNLEKYLRRCLDSVINQSLSEIEVICINDGSTDSSLDILRNYENRDRRIRVINKENEGQGIARNIGINLAAGEYIGFVDGDDWIDPEMYETMYSIAKKNDLDMQICTMKRLDEYGNDIQGRCDYDQYIGCKYDDPSFIFSGYDIAEEIFSIGKFCMNKIYKSSFLNQHKIRFREYKYFEDYIFYFFCFIRAQKISVIRQPFYKYIDRQGSSMCGKTRPLALFEANREIEKHLDFYNVEEQFRQRFEKWKIKRYLSIYYMTDSEYKKQYFTNMKTEFSKIEIKRNPLINIPEKLLYLCVKTIPHALFKYTDTAYKYYKALT